MADDRLQNYEGAANGDVPIPKLGDLQSHLQHLLENPDDDLDADLVGNIQVYVTAHNVHQLREMLLPPIHRIVTVRTRDSKPLFDLISALIAPLSFQQCVDMMTWDVLINTLQPPFQGAAKLAIIIIEKAAQSNEDIEQLDSHPDAIVQLLQAWLEADSIDVSTKAEEALVSLLAADCDVLPESRLRVFDFLTNGHPQEAESDEEVIKQPPGNGVIWRLIFQQHDVLATITKACNPQPPVSRQTSISQNRLLVFLPKLVDFNFRVASQTTFPDLLPMPEALLAQVGPGLLQWAGLNMVDTSDVLLESVLVHLYEDWIANMALLNNSPEKNDVLDKFFRAVVQQYPQVKARLETLPQRTGDWREQVLKEYIDRFL